MRSLLFFLLMLPLSIVAQQRFLVSPDEKIYPIPESGSASATLTRILRSYAGRCDTVPVSSVIGGFRDPEFPSSLTIGVHHKDVIGEWFVAKAPGTIDTVFWENLGAIGAKDSLLEVRLYRSNIYPGHGPGFAPYGAPCSQWGYYRNTNDLDQGVTPFHDEATDPVWIMSSFFGPPTFDPLGEALWDNNGYKAVAHSGGINFLPMDEFGDKPRVKEGDPFFITFRVNSLNSHPYPSDQRTDFSETEFAVTTSDENYPSRNWVFFEHDSAPRTCGFFPGNFISKGWIALGNEMTDSLNVRMFNIWYSMTTEPYVPNAGQLYETHTIAGDSLMFCLNACDPALVDTTKQTWIHFSSGYAIDSLPFPLTHDLPTCVSLPRLPESTMVCYEIRSKGQVSYELPSGCFEILGVESRENMIPKSTALLQNYPNPFNPATNFGFRISDFGMVTLRIYDVLGREIATLVDEKKQPGEYTVLWDATNIPSGVYFYKLTAGRFSEVRKMMLVR